MKPAFTNRFNFVAVAVAVLAWAVAGCASVGTSDLAVISPNGAPSPLPVAAATPAQIDLLADAPDAMSKFGPSAAASHTIAGQSDVGLLVGSPVGTGISDDAQSFGDACSQWLQITAAGQPQFGRTPSIAGIARAEADLPAAHMRLTPGMVPKVSLILGVTHAALGTLSGSGPSYTLAYRIIGARDGSPVGAPITLTGSEDEIVQQLPAAAKQMAIALGVSNPVVPGSVGCSGADMSFLGRSWFAESLPDADKSKLAAMRIRCGFAALLNLSWQTFYAPAESQAAADTALAAFPGNPIVYGFVSNDFPSALAKYQANLTRDTLAHPSNYLYAQSLAVMFDEQKGAGSRAVSAGKRALADDPGNPDAWLTLSDMYGDEANAIRQCRTIGGMTQAQLTAIELPYAYWLSNCERAVELDPRDLSAWIEVANAAAFSGQGSVADKAVRHALHMGGDTYRAYDWMLQLYQPKWYDDHAKLSAATALAANDPALSPAELIDLSENFSDAIYPDLHRVLLGAAESRLTKLLAANPKDASSYELLGDYYDDIGDKPSAQAQYETAVGLDPRNPKYQEVLGGVCYDQGLASEAMRHYVAAETIEPAYPNIHYDIGLVYKRHGKFNDALAEMRQEIKLYPNSSEAYDGLGDVYYEMNLHAKAGAAYLASCRLYPLDPDEWNNAASEFDVADDAKDALDAIEQGETFFPDDSGLEITKQDCFLKLHQPDKTLAICDGDLSMSTDSALVAMSHENIAEAYLAEHKLDKARAEWRRVIVSGDPDAVAAAQGFLRKYGS